MKINAWKCASGLFAGVTIFAVHGFNQNAHAAEGGAAITLYGVSNFGAGILPPPSPYGSVGIGVTYYSADVLRDGNGKKLDVDFDMTVKSVGIGYIRMTDTELFGASVGFGGLLTLTDIQTDFSIPTPGGPLDLSGEDTGLRDALFFPLMLQWNAPPNLFLNASLQVQAPTGKYDVEEHVNVGRNHWAIAPVFGVTYLTDSGFELSSRFEFNFNTENPDTNYTSGMEYKQDFGLGQHIGPWTIGVGGWFYQQLTDDKGPNLTNGNRGRSIALGPVINFFDPQDPGPAVRFQAFKEFGVRNQTEGVSMLLTVGMSF